MASFILSLMFAYPFWTCVLTTLIAFIIFKILRRGQYNLPPGPRGLPIVGYLPYLGKDQHLEFMRLRKIYGGIFSLKLGFRTAIVLSDFNLIKEAYNQDVISDRPPELFHLTDNVTHLGEQKDWKDWRRFTMSTLRTLGMGKNKLEDAIMEEVRDVISELFRAAEKSEDVNLHDLLMPAFSSIVVSLVSGKRSKSEAMTKMIQNYIVNALQYWQITPLFCFFPFLKRFEPFLFPKTKSQKRAFYQFENFLWDEISSHEKEFTDATPEDYIDHFFAELRKTQGQKPGFVKRTLNGNSQILLGAGTDTSQTTVTWALLLLAKYPDIQERVYLEIVQAFGKERQPSWQNKDDLPFLEAVMSETSRMMTVVPLGSAHWTTCDTKLGDYDIPKDSLVFSNIYSIHMDPGLWDRPEIFNPDRFLTPDGKRARDPEYLMPFGIGKRVCPGEKLAREETFLVLAGILQHFEILFPSGGLNMDTETTLICHPVFPLVRVKPRT